MKQDRTIEIRADEKGVKGEVFIPIVDPERYTLEAVGKLDTDYHGKRKTWGAGIRIRF